MINHNEYAGQMIAGKACIYIEKRGLIGVKFFAEVDI